MLLSDNIFFLKLIDMSLCSSTPEGYQTLMTQAGRISPPALLTGGGTSRGVLYVYRGIREIEVEEGERERERVKEDWLLYDRAYI